MIVASSWSSGSVYNGAITLPTHQAGDLIVILGASSGNGFNTPLSGDWTVVVGPNSVSTTMALAWKVAASSSEPTINDARWFQLNAHLHIFVLRADAQKVISIGANAWSEPVTTSDITYPAITLQGTNSRVFAFGHVRNVDGDMTTPPNSSVLQHATTYSTISMASSFLSGVVNTWAQAVITVGGSTGTGKQRTGQSLEIIEASLPRRFSALRMGGI
jgi:hypothetical protein